MQASKALTLIYSMFLFFDLNFNFLVSLSNNIGSGANQVLESLNIDDPLLEIAKNLEEIALKDDYFVARKLYPNVDLYSGIIYRAMGIPTNMFTVMFALGRLPGWLAHWREMVLGGQRINRPRQIYTGDTKRSL